MTTQTEALKLALEAYLCREMPAGTIIGDPKWWVPKIASAIKEALATEAQQSGSVSNEQVEPVGRIASNVKPVMRQEVMLYTDKPLPIGAALYVKEKL